MVGEISLCTFGSTNSWKFRSRSSEIFLVLRASGEFPPGEISSRRPQACERRADFCHGPLIARPLGKPFKMVDFRRPTMSRASGILGFEGVRPASGGFPCRRAFRPTPASLLASGGGLCASPPSRASGGGLLASLPLRASGGGLCASPNVLWIYKNPAFPRIPLKWLVYIWK